MSHSPTAQFTHGTGSGRRADHQIPGGEATALRRLPHPAQRLVAQDQVVLTRRSFAVVPTDDLVVRTANPHGYRLHQDRTIRLGRLRNVPQLRRTLDPWLYR